MCIRDSNYIGRPKLQPVEFEAWVAECGPLANVGNMRLLFGPRPITSPSPDPDHRCEALASSLGFTRGVTEGSVARGGGAKGARQRGQGTPLPVAGNPLRALPTVCCMAPRLARVCIQWEGHKGVGFGLETHTATKTIH